MPAFTTPQQRLETSSMVFVGTAADRGPKGQFRDPISFRVEESFKGIKSGATIVIDPGPGDCVALFQPGVQYLVFASQQSGHSLPVAGQSSYPMPAPQAAPELRWLRGRTRPDWKPRLIGVIDDVYSTLPSSPWKPLVGAEVRLTRNGATVSRVSDASGVFEFDGLNPGEYQVQAAFPRYRLRFGPRTVLVGETCLFPHLGMVVDGSIAGQVRTPAGAPAAGITVDLTVKRPRGEYEAPFAQVKTTTSGRFLFQGVPTGEYWVAVNGFSSPTPKKPIPRAFADVSIGRNEKRSGVSIRLAAPLPPKQVTVRVFMPDGRPASGATLMIEGLADASPLKVQTDEQGKATYSWIQASSGVHASTPDGSNASTSVAAAQTTLELRLGTYKR
jgi:hypothetical protein